MAGMKKADAKKLAAKLIVDWLTHDLTNEGRLDEVDAFMELTKSGQAKVYAAFDDFKALILKKAKIEQQ